MPRWKRWCTQASVDRLCDYHHANINGESLTPGQERGQHQAAGTLQRWVLSRSRGGGGLHVILSDHHTGPVSYQAEDLSSPLHFSGLRERPDKGLRKIQRRKWQHKMEVKWNSDPLPFEIWGESLRSNLLAVQTHVLWIWSLKRRRWNTKNVFTCKNQSVLPNSKLMDINE